MRSMIHVPVCLLLIVIGLASCNSAGEKLGGQSIAAVTISPTVGISNAGASPEASPDAPNLQRPPLYSAAKNPRTEFQNAFPTYKIMSFDTPDDFKKVLTFYEKTLPDQGWVCEADTTNLPCNLYSWTAAEGDVPSNFSLEISFEVREETQISLLMRRWPNVTNIPLYPDAQQVQVNYSKDEEFQAAYPEAKPLWKRVTTYITHSEPEEVEAFYNSRLIPPDWESLKPATSITSDKGLGFRYFRDVDTNMHVDEYRGGVLHITAGSIPDGRTQVVLRVLGTDIQPQLQP